MLFNRAAQAAGDDVRVNLSRRYIGVAQHGLHVAVICRCRPHYGECRQGYRCSVAGRITVQAKSRRARTCIVSIARGGRERGFAFTCRCVFVVPSSCFFFGCLIDKDNRASTEPSAACHGKRVVAARHLEICPPLYVIRKNIC